MEERVNVDSELKKIILDMEFAEKVAELNKMSGKALNAKYETIALKIEELAAFQEENIPNLILNDQWSKVTPSPMSQNLNRSGKVEIIVSYEPVEPVRESSTSSLNRVEYSNIIIERLPRVLPLIKITDDLDVMVDSVLIMHLDSMKIIHLHKSLKRLKHSKTKEIN